MFLEGVITGREGETTFTRVKAPSHSDLEKLVQTISHRIAGYLEKAGLIQRDMENTFSELSIDDEDSLLHLHSIRELLHCGGPNTGNKVFTLQTMPAKDEENYEQLAQISGQILSGLKP